MGTATYMYIYIYRERERVVSLLVQTVKESACNAGDPGSIPGSGRSPGEGNATHSKVLPREFDGQKSLGGYSPWGGKELDMTEG